MIDSPNWVAKMNAHTGVDIRPVPEGRRGMIPGRDMLYPSATMINEAILALPEGETITPRELRARLASEHDVTYTCPVTTTLMLRLVVEATNQVREAGAPLEQLTPIWRTLDPAASALKKLSFDPAWIIAQRKRESTPS